MFAANQTINDQNIVNSYLGVDIKDYNCQKLAPNPIYSNYQKEQLHFPIGAIQKGLKPHTYIGIKRILRRNKEKKRKQHLDTKFIKPLNPKSPEQICVKALRTSFRNELEKNHIESEASIAIRTKAVPKVNTRVTRRQKNQPKVTKTLTIKKQRQRQRRIQLIKLVEQYRPFLLGQFGSRLQGYGRCPKVSRQEILKALGLQLTVQTRVHTNGQAMIPQKQTPIQNKNPYETLFGGDDSEQEV